MLIRNGSHEVFDLQRAYFRDSMPQFCRLNEVQNLHQVHTGWMHLKKYSFFYSTSLQKSKEVQNFCEKSFSVESYHCSSCLKPSLHKSLAYNLWAAKSREQLGSTMVMNLCPVKTGVYSLKSSCHTYNI